MNSTISTKSAEQRAEDGREIDRLATMLKAALVDATKTVGFHGRVGIVASIMDGRIMAAKEVRQRSIQALAVKSKSEDRRAKR